MNKDNRNIEDFLRGKMSQLENSFQDDWSVFEEKLERALFLKRLRIGIAFSVLLIATSVGILSTSNGLSWYTSYSNPYGSSPESGFDVSGSQSQWSVVALEQPVNKHVAEVTSEQVLNKKVLSKKNNCPVAPLVETALVLSTMANGASEGSVNKTPKNKAQKESTMGSSNISNIQNTSDKTLIVASTGGSAAGSELLATEGSAASTVGIGKNTISHVSVIELDGLSTVLADEVAVKPYLTPTPIVKAKPSAYVSPLSERSLWEFSIKAYPNFTFRKFKVDEDKLNLLHRDFIDQVEVAESGGFTFNIGLEVSRKVADATYINSGIEYISYKTDANFDFTNFRTAIIDENTQTISSYRLKADPEQIVINDVNSYNYINIPLSIAYRPWASKHVRLNIETGISYMRFLSAKGNSIDYKTLEIIDLANRDYRKSMGSVSFRVGATYYISSQFNLGFEPTFMYFTNTIYTEEYPFEIIPYSVGLNLKLQVKLN